MLLDKDKGQRVELWMFATFFPPCFRVEVADVKKDNDQIVECSKCFFFHWKRSITICLVATLDLHSDDFFRPCRIWMNADEIIALIVRRSLVRENIAPHKLTNSQVLGAKRDNWQPKRVLVSHLPNARNGFVVVPGFS